MRFSKGIVAIAVASVVAPVMAKDSVYNVRVITKDKLSTWNDASSLFTDWENVGGHFDCEGWSPVPESVDFGNTYLQTRDCSQNQSRVETLREYDEFSSSYKDVGTKTHNRVVSETESRNETGTRRDWNTFTSTFTSWNDYGSEHSHTSWSPAASAQSSDFQQTRGYQHPQERFEQKREKDAVTSDIRNVGAPIRHTQEDARTENRQVNVTASAWYNTTTENFSVWTPAPSNQVADFQQSRGYTQNQAKDWTYKADGSTIHSRTTTKKLTSQTESRSITVAPSAWSDTTKTAYSAWTPAPTTQTATFSQSRDYTQNQTRNWTYKAGSSELYDRDETRGVPSTENRSVSVSWNAWANTSASDTHSCTAWSPATNTKGYNESYTQTRTCQEPQTRVRTYKDGSTTLTSKTESRDLPNIESRAATGVGSWSATTSSYSSWSNSGGAYGHGSYSPAASSQTSNFSQSRSYKQNQTRTRQARERDSISGAIRNVGSPVTESQTLTLSQSRTIGVTVGGYYNTSAGSYSSYSPAASSQTSNFTQSRTYTQYQNRVWTYKSGSSTIHTRNQSRSLTGQSQSRTVTVSVGGWSYTGSAYGYGSWSPAQSTVPSYKSYTATRSYKRNRARTFSYSIGGSYTQTGTVTLSQSSTLTGTQSPIGKSYGSYSAWSNNGSKVCSGSWSPASHNYKPTQNVSQSRGCTQSQVRTRSQYDKYSDGHLVYLGKVSAYQTITASNQTQTVKGTDTYLGKVYGSWSGYSDTGSASCGSYSPSQSGYYTYQTFTQTRSCSISTRRSRSVRDDWKYSSDSTSTEYGYSSRSYNQSRVVYGTKVAAPFPDPCQEYYDRGMQCP